jgi:hypothetical protein
LDALTYGNPRYLVLITAWNEAWHERAAGDPNNTLSGEEAQPLPYGLPSGVEKFHLISSDEATLEVQKLWRQARDLSLHHAPASDYRVLAAWPDFLKIAIDDVLAPAAHTAEYEETAREIRAIARKHAAGFPAVGGVARRQLEAKLTGIESSGVTALLFMYNRFIADITIATIRLKQAFDGAASATEFPV